MSKCMTTIWQKDDYFISTDVHRLDVGMIVNYIAQESYWGEGRPESVMRTAISNSALCFGLYHEALPVAVQVGFARVVSDLAVFAYLSDVFILSEHRGKGLGKWLIDTICTHPDLCGLKRITLMTRTPEFYYPLSFEIYSQSNTSKFMVWTPKPESS